MESGGVEAEDGEDGVEVSESVEALNQSSLVVRSAGASVFKRERIKAEGVVCKYTRRGVN